MKRIITYGTFDMFHIGHLNILKRAKAFGDYLIVGVTSEGYDRSRGKLNVIQNTEVRKKAIEKLDFVDEVVIEEHKGQKQEDIQKHNVDIFVIGDDWKGKFDYLRELCEVVYLPRTEGISSTQLRKNIQDIKLGVLGTGRIAHRFLQECQHVPGIEVTSVHSRDINNIENFISKNNILYGFDDINNFLSSDIDAVYIASPHEFHYIQAKNALLAGKHVLCEKPATLDSTQLDELISLARSKNLIYLEAIKTAYLPAFSKLLDEIKDGIIGEVREVRATFTKLIEDKKSREWQSPYGGATNELASYPLLLAVKVLGKSMKINYFEHKEEDIDFANTIVCMHEDNCISISTVGIGIKSEGCAIISGTKGYIYIPAPWWLTKEFFIKFEDVNKTYKFHYEFEGDGLRYEISEFKSLIQRDQVESTLLTFKDMQNINKIISEYKGL